MLNKYGIIKHLLFPCLSPLDAYICDQLPNFPKDFPPTENVWLPAQWMFILLSLEQDTIAKMMDFSIPNGLLVDLTALTILCF